MTFSSPGLAIYLAAFALASGALIASTTLHRDVLSNCLHSPVSFFDTTPIGRIVNRFSKDVDLVDTSIPRNWEMTVKCGLNVLSTLFVICFNIPTFLWPAFPLAAFYVLVQVQSHPTLHDGCCVFTLGCFFAVLFKSYHPLTSLTMHLPTTTKCFQSYHALVSLTKSTTTKSCHPLTCLIIHSLILPSTH